LKKIARSFFVRYQNVEIAGSQACADNAVFRFSARNANRKVFLAQQGGFKADGSSVERMVSNFPLFIDEASQDISNGTFFPKQSDLAFGKLLIAIFLQKYLTRGLTMGAIK
jgi:hypothetical protein